MKSVNDPFPVESENAERKKQRERLIKKKLKQCEIKLSQTISNVEIKPLKSLRLHVEEPTVTGKSVAYSVGVSLRSFKNRQKTQPNF